MMPSRLHVPALAALSCCLVACVRGVAPASSSVTPPATITDAANDIWQIKVTRSGGLAGLEEVFTANAASTALLVSDVTRGTGTTVALAAGQKLALGQAIASRMHAPDTESFSPSCRNCYQFEMTISSGAGSRQRKVRLDSMTLESSPDASLIEHIVAIARAAPARATP